MTVKISEMKIKHYNEVFALWEKTEGVGLSEADSKENIEKYLQRNPKNSFIASENEKIIGAVLCGNDGRRGYLHHLAVLETCRKQGIGKLLVEKCFEKLSQEGIERCHIFVIDKNEEGKKFWEKLGWSSRKHLLIFSKNV
ncbi:GNAT family N-acetyltransferase [bacterium]|nr:GNAT family N-acetyltransferase [bacterium]